MNLYIGIDGGGSKTKCVLCDESLNVLSELQSGPSNFLTIGTETVSKTIFDLVKKCCYDNNIQSTQVKNVLLGTTGAGRKSDAEKLVSAFKLMTESSNFSINNFEVVSDARIALEGAFSGTPGSILIAGTGSIMFGKDKNGDIHRVGGFGRQIGDEGSGLTIGKLGLNIISKCYDGRISQSRLTEKFEAKFNISNQNQLITSVYSDDFKIQDVAPLVIESAVEGDEQCHEILDKQSDELLLHILAMSKKLHEEKMKLVFIGGTIANENKYSQMLREKINMFLPKIIIQKPDYPPEIGAVIMAKANS